MVLVCIVWVVFSLVCLMIWMLEVWCSGCVVMGLRCFRRLRKLKIVWMGWFWGWFLGMWIWVVFVGIVGLRFFERCDL